MVSIDNITVEGRSASDESSPLPSFAPAPARFLNLFQGTFVPFLLPYFVEDKAYFKDDVVFIEPNFYKCLKDGITTAPPSENWVLENDSTDNYIQNSDIERAFLEAKVNFNPSFFKDDETAQMVFYYLAAHYLVIDIRNRQNPFATGFIDFTRSKSVGSVSESYGIPQWMLNNQILGAYSQTGFGRKYLSLIQPYLVGNIIYTQGAVNFG